MLTLRLARLADIDLIKTLMHRAITELQKGFLAAEAGHDVPHYMVETIALAGMLIC